MEPHDWQPRGLSSNRQVCWIIASIARRRGSARVGQACITRSKSGPISTEFGKLDGKTRSPFDVTCFSVSSLGQSSTGLENRHIREGIVSSNLTLSASIPEETAVFSGVSSFWSQSLFTFGSAPDRTVQLLLASVFVKPDGKTSIYRTHPRSISARSFGSGRVSPIRGFSLEMTSQQ